MLGVHVPFILVAFPLIFESVYSENQNEVSQNKNNNDFVDFGTVIARNLTTNISVSSADLNEKMVSFGEKMDGNVSITDRSEKLDLTSYSDDKILNISDEKSNNPSNVSIMDRSAYQEQLLPDQKPNNVIQLNAPKNMTIEPKKLENFRPSPPLETYYEYNKFPVKPVLPEPKMVKNYGNVNSEDRKSVVQGEVIPIENERSRTLHNFETGFSPFGNGNFPNSERLQNILPIDSKRANIKNNNNAPPWVPEKRINNINRKNEYVGDAPWVTRIRFPQDLSTNDNPYPFVQKPDQSAPCCQENVGQNVQYVTPNNFGQLPPKNNEYLPPVEDNNKLSLTQAISNFNNLKNTFNNIIPNKVGYLPPIPTYGSTGGGNIETKNRYLPPSFSSLGSNEEVNFNKLVEVPKTYYSGNPNKYSSHHKTFESVYNLMEKPSYESHKHSDGMSYSPWKKILKLFATFIPIGLLISALTPTVITVTNVNDTNDMAATRYRSDNGPKKELTNHILSSLDYFDKLNENGCEYRVFCELLVSASHMPNSVHHVENLLDNFAKHEIDYKNKADELRKVFAAVRNHDCSSISCQFIKNPT